MGWNTPVLILNDALDQIEKDAEGFTNRLTHACLGVHRSDGRAHIDIPAGHHANAAHVLRPSHADTTRLLVSHGNLLIDLDPNASDDLWKRAETDKFIRDELKRRAQFALLASKTALSRLDKLGD